MIIGEFRSSLDILVSDRLTEAVTRVLPGWRVLSVKASLPDDVAPVAAVISAEQDRNCLEMAGFADLPVICSGDVASLTRNIVDLLARRLHETQRDAAESRSAAALLRRENQEQARRMRMLEHFSSALGGPRWLKSLDWAPTIDVIELSAPVMQRLPLNTVALAAVDLWLPDSTPDEVAEMTVDLIDADDTLLVRLSHEVLAGRAGGGWVRFVAPEPLTGPARDLTIRVAAAKRLHIGLGLSTPVPDLRFAVHLDGSAVSDAPVAMRVWRADYLATLPRANLPSGAGQIAQHLALAELSTPQLLSDAHLAKDYVTAEYWAREDAILVHPSAQAPVCAILRDVDVASVSSVSALVNVAHWQAPTLGFAVGVCPRGVASADNWQDHIGPYVFLPSGGWGECHSILPASTPNRSRVDILLSTMLAGHRPNDHAWALFRRLSLGIAQP